MPKLTKTQNTAVDQNTKRTFSIAMFVVQLPEMLGAVTALIEAVFSHGY